MNGSQQRPKGTRRGAALRRAGLLVVGVWMGVAACVGFPDRLCSEDAHCRPEEWCSPLTGECELRPVTGDERVPSVSLLEAPAVLTGERDATFAFECQVAGCTYECRLDEAAWFACIAPWTYDGLDDGSHVFEVRGVDTRGRPGPPTEHRWTIDSRAPVVTVASSPPELTNDPTAIVDLACDKDGCTFLCRLGGTFETGCEPPVVYPDLPDGAYVFRARGLDEAGNYSAPATVAFEIDTVRPVATITGGPRERTVQTHATFTFECDKEGCTFACGLWSEADDGSNGNGGGDEGEDGGEEDETGGLVPCASPVTYTDLPLGAHALTVVPTDLAGNVGEPVHHAWSVEARWRDVSAGSNHTCAIREDGSLWCWGFNIFGQIGDGTMTDRERPVRIGAGRSWKQVSAADAHTCAVAEEGSLWCWGSNWNHVLGIEGSSQEDFFTTPERVGSDTDWTMVATAPHHGCALRESGRAWCWGDARMGALGHWPGSSFAQTPGPMASEESWSVIRAGTMHTCALRVDDASLWCWGFGGSVNEDGGWEARRITELSGWTDVGVSFRLGPWDRAYHACGTVAGALHCWGTNGSGQVGTGSTSSWVADPVQVGDETDWGTVGTGRNHSCAARIGDGRLRCWGDNERGQLGDPDAGLERHLPGPVTGDPGIGWSRVSGGAHHTCGIDDEGVLWCWGANTRGQVGTGSGEAEHPLPVEIL